MIYDVYDRLLFHFNKPAFDVFCLFCLFCNTSVREILVRTEICYLFMHEVIVQ